MIAIVVGVQVYRAVRGFSRRLAFRGRFDSVVGGVADQVRHGIGESIEDAFIEVGRLPGEFERDVFVAQPRDVADDPRKAAEKLLDGNHANLHHGLLQLAEHAGLKCKRIGQFCA